MRFAVTGPDGEVLRAGRDRAVLKQDLSQKLHLKHWDALRKQWERQDITGWDFGDLPESITVTAEGSAHWRVFPGLQADSESGRIDLRLFPNPQAAAKAHPRGVAALYRIHFSRELRLLKKSLKLPADLSRATAAFGGSQHFNRRMLETVTEKLFCRSIRSRQAFEEYAAEVGRQIYPEGQKLLEEVLPVMRAWDAAQERILRLEAVNSANSALLQICANVKAQMKRLIPDHFMAIYDSDRLAELPRYLNARAVRVERAAVDSEKDRLKTLQFNRFADALDRLLGSLSAETSDEKRTALEEYFWMVEEFHVSLFAQELGTAIPVSDKRLEKKQADLERML
jgi:ATP-dependent helicase HrpA